MLELSLLPMSLFPAPALGSDTAAEPSWVSSQNKTESRAVMEPACGGNCKELCKRYLTGRCRGSRAASGPALPSSRTGLGRGHGAPPRGAPDWAGELARGR